MADIAYAEDEGFAVRTNLTQGFIKIRFSVLRVGQDSFSVDLAYSPEGRLVLVGLQKVLIGSSIKDTEEARHTAHSAILKKYLDDQIDFEWGTVQCKNDLKLAYAFIALIYQEESDVLAKLRPPLKEDEDENAG